MTVKVRLPRILTQTVRAGLRHEVTGGDVGQVLNRLFETEPGLRNHLIDEDGQIRTHVLVFVDGERADLTTPVPDGGEVQVLQAVSGG
ncbi:MAG: MoaD/ThiS family protein [Acidimicrobiia bacterium]